MKRIGFKRWVAVVTAMSWAGGCLADAFDFLPLGRPRAEDPTMPRPLGISLSAYRQSQDYQIGDLTAVSPDPMVNLILRAAVTQVKNGAIDIDNRVDEQSIHADIWLLPFFNLFGFVGNVDGKTTVRLDPPLPSLRFDYDGIVYGVGGVLAAGYRRFFASATTTYTATDLEEETASVRAWVFQPRVGMAWREVARGTDLSCWVGGMYQRVNEKHHGVLTVEGLGDVAYDVELEDEEPWNGVAGISATFGTRWQITLEGGVGQRRNAEVVAAYRF